MLKVNTDKISVPDFAKKYGFVKLEIDDITYLRGDDMLLFKDDGTLLIDLSFRYKDMTIEELFDMFSGGDVIKEEGR